LDGDTDVVEHTFASAACFIIGFRHKEQQVSFPYLPAAPPAACAADTCQRPAVRSAAVCRVHLADLLRAEGEPIHWKDPEFAGWKASVIWFERLAMDGVPAWILSSDRPRWVIDMYALLDPNEQRALAQAALDMLGTHLADTFGAMRLEPPTKYDGKILLRLHLAVPADGIEELRPRLEFLMEAYLRELFGAGADLWVVAQPADAIDESPEAAHTDE
jgi:hypothetical protein